MTDTIVELNRVSCPLMVLLWCDSLREAREYFDVGVDIRRIARRVLRGGCGNADENPGFPNLGQSTSFPFWPN